MIVKDRRCERVRLIGNPPFEGNQPTQTMQSPNQNANPDRVSIVIWDKRNDRGTIVWR